MPPNFCRRSNKKPSIPIYAFCRLVDDEIDEIGDGNEAEAIKTVEKWEEKLLRVFEGKGENQKAKGKGKGKTESDEQYFVFLAWSDLLKTYKIPHELPLELMQGVLMDTTKKRYENFDELYVYCYRVASTVGLMSSEILGYSDKKALEYAEAMGIGMQLTNILRDVKEDAAMGRIYLPQEDLRKFDVSERTDFGK